MRRLVPLKATPGLPERIQAVEVSKLKKVLLKLSDALRDPATREKQFRDFPMIWPKAEDLLNLDMSIFGLAQTLLSIKRLPYLDTLKLIDQRWTSLKLSQRVALLIKRAKENLDQVVSEQPESPYDRIRRIADSDVSQSKLAKRFLAQHFKLREGKMKPGDVRWQNYYHLFRGGEAVIRFSNDVVISDHAQAAYMRYLEWERADFLLQRRSYEAALRLEREQPIRDWLAGIEQRDASIEPERREVKSKQVRDRKRRSRVRKKALQKSVTSTEAASSLSVGSVRSLRDLTFPY